MDQNRRLRIVPYAEYQAGRRIQPLPAEVSTLLSQQMQENEELAALLAQREDELTDAYDMIDQLTAAYDEINAKYRRLSAYLLKLELELRQLNRTLPQDPPRRLTAARAAATMDELLASASKSHKYTLKQRDNVIYRVKRKE